MTLAVLDCGNSPYLVWQSGLGNVVFALLIGFLKIDNFHFHRAEALLPSLLSSESRFPPKVIVYHMIHAQHLVR